MKRLTLLAISFSILAAGSEKPSSFVRFSGLTEEQKKNFTNRFKQSKREVGFKKMGRISPLGKSSKADFNKLQRSSMKTHYRRPPLENEKFLKSNRLYRETNDSRETETILKANEDLYGRWNLESEEEEAIFIKLKSSVTIPNLEQFLGLSLPDGKGINMNDESEEPAPTWALDYMYAADYLRHGFIVLSNFPWFGKGAAIRDGETVYDLVLYYDDRSIEGPDEYFDFITSVNLRHPTAGELYIINEEEFQSISFGRGHSHDGEMAFGGGILSLVFDGAGALTVSDPFDPENPETLEYSVSDDGIVTIEDGPLTVTNSDGSVLAFIEDDEENEEGMMGLGFEVAVGANLASFQGDYYGVLIGQESEEILGKVYEYPLVEVYGINFDGAGNVTSQILSDEDGEVDEGTYTVNENGMLVIGEGEVMGFLSADSAYGVLADTPNEDGEGSDEKMALLLKLGTDKSEASLEGVFRYGSFDVNAEVDGLDYEIDFGFYTGEVEFDGEGNYTDIDPDGENHTGTYEVAEDGKLTFDGQEIGFLGSGDDVILFAAYLEEGLSVEAWTGMAIKKSSGLTESSLSGNYGAAYIELSSDGDQVYVENHVTLDFFGISDSVVTATVVDEGYDEEGELYVDLRFPIPMGISLHNFEIKGYTYEGEELWYSAGGDLEYDRLILPSGVELPLPVLGDQWADDFEYTIDMELQSDKLGRVIYTETWLDTTGEQVWIDTSDFAWSASDDTLTIIEHIWEWDEEIEEEYESYEKMLIPYTVADNSLTLGGEFEPCDYWEEDDWFNSWEECINYDYPILGLAMAFLGKEVIEDYYAVAEQVFNYDGEVPDKPTLASTLPMVADMPNIFMEDIEVSGNRLYGGGYAEFEDGLDEYLRILDISNPLQPKELHFSRLAADIGWYFDMIVKGNTVIHNSQYGPDFYDVSGDKISQIAKGMSSLSFDGVNDYVDISTLADNMAGVTDWAISLWVNPVMASFPEGGAAIFATNCDNGTSNCNKIEIYIKKSNAKVIVYENPGGDDLIGSTTITDDWSHVVYSKTGSTGTLYLNGTSQGTHTVNHAAFVASDKWSLAQEFDGTTVTNEFFGLMDEVAVWSDDLSTDQVTAVFNAGRSGDLLATEVDIPVGYWRFEEGTGSVLGDASGNSNDGTIYGASWLNSEVKSVADTKCCTGQGMALQGNNLYTTRWSQDYALRIIDVTVPSKPSLVTEVTLEDLNTKVDSDNNEIVPYFDDIKVNDSYVFILDQNAGDGTDTCWEDEDPWDRHSVVRIHSTTAPYSQVGLANVKAADMIEVDGKYIYTVACGNFYVYDYSDLDDIKQVAILREWSAGEETSYEFTFFESFNGEIEKIGNYIYIARGGYDDWNHLGVNVIDVSDPTNPVHLANLPDDIFTEDYDGGYDYAARSVEMTSNGYLLVAQQSSTDDAGDLYVYETNFAPQPFSLMFPPNGMEVEITQDNAWEESITFAWSSSADFEGTEMKYSVFFDDGLDPLYYHILDACEDAENTCTIPLHRMKNYLYIEGLSSVSGVWDVLATDGISNTYSSNGPYKLTIDASTVSSVDDNNVPMDFALHSNFPNPFNPTTSIKYDLPEDASVSLMIFDITGREIRHLVNESQNAGFKAIMWDGTNNYGHQVGTGMYLYQIKAGSFVQTRKMLLMK